MHALTNYFERKIIRCVANSPVEESKRLSNPPLAICIEERSSMSPSAFTLLLLSASLAGPGTTITITTPTPPPAWALAERALLEAGVEAAEEYAAKYLDERGYLRCVERWGGNDGPDDAMENFHNWPLFHALGADDRILDLYKLAWEGHLKQYTEARAPGIPMAQDGMFYREFITSFDWEHTGEGLQAFFFYGLSAPDDLRYLSRVRRFAGFYMNEDAEARNYDPKHKIIRSLHNGSRGPKLTPATQEDWGGLPVPGKPERLSRYDTAANIRGDHPLNLCACTLAMTAYLLTQETKYRDWILEYSNAWRDRILENGGNIPTNIGLDGTIGGEWDGKWYGGTFGWNFYPQSSGRNYYIRGPRIAFGECILLTGDLSYMEPLRQQIDNLYEASKVIDGVRMFPNKHGDDGWYGYTSSARPDVQRNTYLFSMNPHDKRRLLDDPWLSFLAGRNPEYPLRALQDAFAAVRQRIADLRADPTTEETRGSDWTHDYNPLTTAALVNLMLGGVDPGKAGNVLHTQVRYFDPQRRRAGLPQDVAALIDRIEPEAVSLTLVNVSPQHARTVIVQMGAYAEHHCRAVEVGQRSETVDATSFTVSLLPGTSAKMRVTLERYAHQPTLSFPWDRAWMLDEKP